MVELRHLATSELAYGLLNGLKRRVEFGELANTFKRVYSVCMKFSSARVW